MLYNHYEIIDLLTFVKNMNEEIDALLAYDLSSEKYVFINNLKKDKVKKNQHNIKQNQEDTRIVYYSNKKSAYAVLKQLVEKQFPGISYTKEIRLQLESAILEGTIIYDSSIKEKQYIDFESGLQYFNSCFLPEHFYIENENKYDMKDFVNDILPKHKEFNILLGNLFNDNKKDIAWFLNWLLSSFNGKKNLAAPIIKGIQGGGKGLLMSFIEYYFGKNNVLTASNELLTSQFNEQMENRLFVNLNEITLNKNRELYEKLKQWITDNTYNLNIKSIKQRSKANNMNFLITTNNHIPIEVDLEDRRYSIFETKPINIKTIVEEDFFENYENDFDSFIIDLKKVKVDYKKADLAILNETKLAISMASTTKKELLMKLIKSSKIDLLKKFEDDFLESDLYDKATNRIYWDIFINDIEKGEINNKIAIWAYKIFVDKDALNNTIGRDYNVYLGFPKDTTRKGKRVKYRKIVKYNKTEIKKLEEEVEDNFIKLN